MKAEVKDDRGRTNGEPSRDDAVITLEKSMIRT